MLIEVTSIFLRFEKTEYETIHVQFVMYKTLPRTLQKQHVLLEQLLLCVKERRGVKNNRKVLMQEARRLSLLPLQE